MLGYTFEAKHHRGQVVAGDRTCVLVSAIEVG